MALTHRRERKKKQMARIKIATSICLKTAWLPVGIQGLQRCFVSGWIALVSVLGYANCCLGAYGSWHALMPPDYKNSWKGRVKILLICGSLFAAGSGLIAIGNFTAITLGGLQISLVLVSAMPGLAGRLAYRWREMSLIT
jgi:hypothetical protein